MKKPLDSHSKRVQSESVRRGQAAGRRQAAVSTGRTVRQGSSKNRVSDNAYSQNDVSIGLPDRIRRLIVFGILTVVLAVIAYAAVGNIRNWQQFRADATTGDSAAGGEQTPTPDYPNRIGLVSGHRGNDSGSVCQDGLTEAQLNFSTTVRVAELLRSQGYTVDILDEFDPRLKGYRARLLLSIHADSCTYINELATGFKVAHVLDSTALDQEDRLVACLTNRYRTMTGLRFHANTVTYDMTKYHAFYEVDATTPAAIIETGFMNLDRPILTGKPELVTQGIMNGLLCYLNNEDPKSP